MYAAIGIVILLVMVFGGFASGSLASRIDDAQPTVIVSADAGSRSGKVLPYKPLLDEAIRLATHQPQKVLLIDDLIATGGTMMAGRRLLEKLGGTVIEGAAIVDLPELGGSQRLQASGLALFTLVDFEEH